MENFRHFHYEQRGANLRDHTIRHSPLPGLLALIAASSATLVVLVGMSRQYSSLRFAEESRLPTDAVGTKLGDLLQTGIEGSKPKDQILLAVMGPCESCSAAKFSEGSEMPRKYSRVIFVYESKPRAVRSRDRNRYRYIFDPSGRISSDLGIAVPPRLFEIDGTGTVTRAQTGVNSLDQMLSGDERG